MKRINFTNKKAELTLTVVVSAVIALVVLIVMIYIFTNSSQKSAKTFGSCALNGGTCKTTGQCGASGSLSGYTCSEGQECCVKSDWLCTEEEKAAGKCN